MDLDQIEVHIKQLKNARNISKKDINGSRYGLREVL